MQAPRWLAHAFALDEPAPVAPNPTQHAVVERLAVEVVRRHLTQPALLALEVCTPLNFVSAQGLQFFQPMLASFTDTRSYDEFVRFLEQRGSVDYIRQRIESLERDATERETSRQP